MTFNKLTEHIRKLNAEQQRLYEQRRDEALKKIRELRQRNKYIEHAKTRTTTSH